MLTIASRLSALRLPKLEPRHWAASFVLVTVFALNLIAGLSILGLGGPANRAAANVPGSLSAAVEAHVPPAPEPLRFQKVAPQDAVAINASVPVADLPNPPARPFQLIASSVVDRQRAINCLTSAIYYEAATEPVEGQRAVAQVVLNRVRHPAYPNSVCGVVYQGSQRATGCQFTFTCDGSLARAPMASFWKRARQVAEQALAGAVYKPVGWATHYHTNWVVPYWSSSLVKAAIVGTHIFYRWTGGWGTGPAFRTRYAGVEPDVSRLGRLSPSLPATVVPTADGVLTDVAAAELGTEGKPVVPTSIDSFQRAVLRRYEPAKAEGVATLLINQTRKGEAVASSYRWALTGDNAGPKEAPLGKKAEPAKTEATKPAQPIALEGVRKVGEPSGSGATK